MARITCNQARYYLAGITTKQQFVSSCAMCRAVSGTGHCFDRDKALINVSAALAARRECEYAGDYTASGR